MHDAKHHLDRLVGQRLLVLGDLMLDRYIWGDAERVELSTTTLVAHLQSRGHSAIRQEVS